MYSSIMVFTLIAATTVSGRLFQTDTTLSEKKLSANKQSCLVLDEFFAMTSCGIHCEVGSACVIGHRCWRHI